MDSLTLKVSGGKVECLRCKGWWRWSVWEPRITWEMGLWRECEGASWLHSLTWEDPSYFRVGWEPSLSMECWTGKSKLHTWKHPLLSVSLLRMQNDQLLCVPVCSLTFPPRYTALQTMAQNKLFLQVTCVEIFYHSNRKRTYVTEIDQKRPQRRTKDILRDQA